MRPRTPPPHYTLSYSNPSSHLPPEGPALPIFVQSMQNQKENKVLKISIPAMHTYMIQQADSASTDELKVSLLSGEAEVLGMELKKYYPLKFKMPCIVLIFTWEGCEIEAEWPEDKNAKSSEEWLDISLHNHLPETPMLKYLHLHYDLTILRRIAQQKIQKGPRLAIVGSDNSGIAYSSRLMVTWAGKLNMEPIFVDLDLENSLFLDGSVGAAAYKYRVCTTEDIFEKCDRICMVYGNRRIRTASFLNTARLLSKHIQNRLANEMEEVKWKGLKKEMSNFASGLILQCPRISDDKKNLKEILAELFAIFEITHVLIVDNPDISSFISRNCPNIQKYMAPRIEGVENLNKLPRKTKIMRYFGSEPTKEEKMSFEDVTLYEIIEEEHRLPYVRVVDIRTELVNKTGVAILQAERPQGEQPESIAQRILQSVVVMGVRIARIGEDFVTFDVPNIEVFGRCKQKIWVSMISEKNTI